MSLGPGWIHDIFDAKLVFEEKGYDEVDDQYAIQHLGIEKPPKVKAYDGKGGISGKLVIVPPEGKDVKHHGVLIILKSSSHGPFEERSVVLREWTLLEAGSIAEPLEVGFDLDLSEIDTLRDTFTGNAMSLRHTLGYRIVRPWYTFSVRGEEAW